jgi:hypothetical protein
MMQTVAALIPAAVDYERTLVLAIEVSNKSWVLAAQVPGLPYTKAKRTINPDAQSLMAAIAGYRARATATGHSVERVITVYEAGWPGRRSEGTSPLFGMALRRRLHRVVPFSWSSPVPNAGQWLGSTPAGCEVCRGSLQ